MIDQFLSKCALDQKFLGFELQFREVIFNASAQLLQLVMQALVDQHDASFQAGPKDVYIEQRPLDITGLFGPMHLHRDYYLNSGSGHCPADAALGLETAYTPALARMICRGAAKSPYQEASEDLFEFAGVKVSDRQIQRLVLQVAPAVGPWLKTQPSKPEKGMIYICADGTGVPMRKEVLRGRKGKQPDGSAKTREAKLGCVFLQSKVDEKGRPVRQEDSTSYVGSFKGASDFGLLLRQEAQRRGLAQSTTIIFIGDGAAWVWELARVNFSSAICILDFYHAFQHVHGLGVALWGKESPEGKKRIKRWKGWLLKDKAAQIIKEAKEEMAQCLDTEQASKEIAYLENNLARMSYGTFRKAGFFIGSGVVEAGCKAVIGKRMKGSGMLWSEEGAQLMLDLRCAFSSNLLNSFWQDRTEARAAQNDPIKFAA